MYRLWCLECDQASVTGRTVEDALDEALDRMWLATHWGSTARDALGERDWPRVTCPECAQAVES